MVTSYESVLTFYVHTETVPGTCLPRASDPFLALRTNEAVSRELHLKCVRDFSAAVVYCIWYKNFFFKCEMSPVIRPAHRKRRGGERRREKEGAGRGGINAWMNRNHKKSALTSLPQNDPLLLV